MNVLAVFNLKGGVGKTATAVNLAWLSAQEGARTLLWDLDPQGAAGFYFRVQPPAKGNVRRLVERKEDLQSFIRGTDFPHLDLLPSDFTYRNLDLALDEARKPTRRLAKLIKPLADQYDRVFFDCPPGFSLLSENIFLAAHLLLVPVIPTTLSLRTLGQIRTWLDTHSPGEAQLLPFFSMVDRRKALHRTLCTEHAGEVFTPHAIPFSSAVEKMGLKRAPLLSYDHRSPAALAYRSLWDAVKEREAARNPKGV
jgi:cellulose biosynthesis protein BcsQ